MTQTETHPWHAVLDDLIGHVQYLHEKGDRIIAGSPTLLAALGAAASQTNRPLSISVDNSRLESTKIDANRPPSTAIENPSEKLSALHASIASCSLCPLSQTRRHAVPGQGNANAPDILFIDESPAPEDDATGVAAAPGAHGDLLRKMISAMGYTPEQVFITSVCKCFPPDAPRPAQESLEACRPHLDAQIKLLRPKAIVLLGAGATMALLKQSAGSAVAKSLGVWTRYNNIPVMPTYAPGFMLKFPAVKKHAWQHLQTVMRHLGKVK